jgi:hypothetical protein
MAVFSGRFYQADAAVTQLTTRQFYITVTDFVGNPAGSFGPYLNGRYDNLTVPPVVPADKRVTFTVIEGGQPKTTVGYLDGAPTRPQTVDILVPD